MIYQSDMAVDLIYISRAADTDRLLNKEKVPTQIQNFRF